MVFRVTSLLATENLTLPTPLNIDTSPSHWLPPPSATPTEWTTQVLRESGHLTAATPKPRARKPKGTPENSPVSLSRLPAVGTSCGHVYAARRRPPVTYVVLEVFEVRLHRAESRWRDPGEPESDGHKGWCLQDTTDTTEAFSGPATQRNIQMETEAQRTIQMGTEVNEPFRWNPRTRMAESSRKAARAAE